MIYFKGIYDSWKEFEVLVESAGAAEYTDGISAKG